ncbi:MAG: radical SAM protein [Nitrososphaerales archaeon]
MSPYRKGASTCKVCESEDKLVSSTLGVCVECIRSKPDDALPLTYEAHRVARALIGLPDKPAKNRGGIPCAVCSNRCILGEGEVGYCGLKINFKGRLKSLTSIKQGLFYHYLDPHVTNCCSAWCCPAGTGIGYPQYAATNGAELGYYNLAIFFYGCNFDCLFCQNHSHKSFANIKPKDINTLLDTTLGNRRITCWCFFGGSPEPQLPFALEASKTVLESVGKRILRICFEWNGCGNPHLVRKAAELAYRSGGNLKFDLKCWSENLSKALCGVSNREAFENLRLVAEAFKPLREAPPLITATTLLVPGYVDEFEVGQIASFLSEIDQNIPYSLLVFHPDYRLLDLPITSAAHVERCLKAAKSFLKRVNVGNVELLGRFRIEFNRYM